MALSVKPYINPYITGNPVHGDFGFFGRAKILREVEQILASPGQNAVALFGQRRIGKTSILRELQGRLPKDQYIAVYQDLQDMAQSPMGDVLAGLAGEVVSELSLDGLEFSLDSQAQDFQKRFLPRIYEFLQDKKRRLVFLFDEFDVLNIVQRERLPDNAAANQLFPTLRRWLREEPQLAFIFALGRNLDDLDSDFLSTFKSSQTVQISVLSKENTTALITAPKSICYTDEAIERIYTLTNGHPFFTQSFCSLCFDLAFSRDQPEENSSLSPTITVKDIETLIPTVFNRNESVFTWIWDGLPPVEKLTTSALAELLVDTTATATSEQIESTLKRHSNRLITRDLEVSPEKLVKWQLLRKRGNSYQFLVPLLHQWIRLKKPLASVHDEFDRLHPRADYYFQIAKLDYQENKLDDATINLERSLNLDPNHLQASLLMGDIQLEQNKVDEALNFYERAYTIAPEQSRRKLVSGLFAQAESLSVTWDITLINALRSYHRIKEIDPDNDQVQERVNSFVVKKIEAWLNELAKTDDGSALSHASRLLNNLVEEKIWPEQAKKLLVVILLKRINKLEAIKVAFEAIQRQINLGQFTEAIQTFEKAYSVAPKHLRRKLINVFFKLIDNLPAKKEKTLLGILEVYQRVKVIDPYVDTIQVRINHLSIEIEAWLRELAEKEQFFELKDVSEKLIDLTRNEVWLKKAAKFEDDKKLKIAHETVTAQIASGQFTKAVQTLHEMFDNYPDIKDQYEKLLLNIEELHHSNRKKRLIGKSFIIVSTIVSSYIIGAVIGNWLEVPPTRVLLFTPIIFIPPLEITNSFTLFGLIISWLYIKKWERKEGDKRYSIEDFFRSFGWVFLYLIGHLTVLGGFSLVVGMLVWYQFGTFLGLYIAIGVSIIITLFIRFRFST